MLWREVNAETYRQLRRAVLDGRRRALELDLTPLLARLAVRAGLDRQVAARLPASRGTVQLLSADQVGQVADAARALRLAAWGLAIGAILAAVRGAALAPGRAAGLRGVGWAWLVAGAAVLVARQLIGARWIDGSSSTRRRRRQLRPRGGC